MFIFTGNGRQNQGLIKSKAAKFRYFIIYFLFLSIGVPVLGTSYTAGLNALNETFDSKNVGNGSTSVDVVIYSAYVDNKSWIENNRMYLPSDVPLTWSVENADVTGGNKANVRKYALSINSLNHGDAAAAAANSSNSWNISNKQKDNNKASESVSALLLRYMIGASYSPSNWETLVKSKLSEAVKNQGGGKDKNSLVNRLAGSAIELTSKQGYKYMPYVNPLVKMGMIRGVLRLKMLKVGGISLLKLISLVRNLIFSIKGFADNWLGGIYSENWVKAF